MTTRSLLILAVVAVLVTGSAALAETAKEVLVQANVPANNTGIQVAAGDEVTIEYTGGLWAEAKGSALDVDADGTDRCDDYLDEKGLRNYLVLPSEDCMALIGRIGTAGGQWFEVGKNHSVTADKAGALFLAANDVYKGASDHCFGDNRGCLKVRVTLNKGTATTPPEPTKPLPQYLAKVQVTVKSTVDNDALEGARGWVLGPWEPYWFGRVWGRVHGMKDQFLKSGMGKVKEGQDMVVQGVEEPLANQLAQGQEEPPADTNFWNGIELSGVVNARKNLPKPMTYPRWRFAFKSNANGKANFALLPGLYTVFVVAPDGKSSVCEQKWVQASKTNDWQFGFAVKVDRIDIVAKKIFEWAYYDVTKRKVFFWAQADVTGNATTFPMAYRIAVRSMYGSWNIDGTVTSAKKGWTEFSCSLDQLGLSEQFDLLYARQWLSVGAAGAWFDRENKVKEKNEDNNKVNGAVKLWWDWKKLQQKYQNNGSNDPWGYTLYE